MEGERQRERKREGEIKREKRKSDIRKDTKKRRKVVYVKKNVEYIYVYIFK